MPRSGNYGAADRIPWGVVREAGEYVGFREGGVLDLAAGWVHQYAAQSGNYPSVRGCHYALIALCSEAGFVYRNTLGAYNTLVRFTAGLRRSGVFPSFDDPTRSVQRPLRFDSAVDRIRSATSTMKLDRMAGQPWQTWVVAEKRGMGGRVFNWVADKGIPVVPLGGFASESIERRVRESIELDGRPARGLFISDFDPSGLLLPIKFQQHVPFTEIVRVALTVEQVDDLDLPTDPAPEEDSRLAWFIEQTGRNVQVESDALDALHPGVLKEALLDAIHDEWDDDAHAAVLEREEEARWQMACATEFIAVNTDERGPLTPPRRSP